MQIHCKGVSLVIRMRRNSVYLKIISQPLRILSTYFKDLKHGANYTGCPRRNGKNFGRVFLMLKYTDITQNTYIQS